MFAVSTTGVMAPVARAWHAWRARGYGTKPKVRAPSIVALPAALGRSKPSISRPTVTRTDKQSAFPRGPHPPASVSFFDEDPAWDAVVAAETQASNENTPNDARDGAALAMSDDFVASQPLEYERSIAVFVCLAVAAVVLSVPFGFVRWNLSTLAPLVWWQLGLSTALGTAAAGPPISCAKRITDAGGGAGGKPRTIWSPHMISTAFRPCTLRSRCSSSAR